MATRASPHPTRAWTILLGIVLALALALRLHGLGWGLPGVYEEAYPFKKAWDMWGFGPMRRFGLDPHFFKYPSLTLYLQMAGQALTFALLRVTGAAHSMMDVRVLYLFDKTAFYLVGRSITALLGAATVLPVWALARRAAGARAALIAALLVAIHPALVEKSQVIEVDVPLTFFAALALALAAGCAERAEPRRMLFAGLAAGLAASCKYPGLLLAIPLALAAWQGTCGAARGPAKQDAPERDRRSGAGAGPPAVTRGRAGATDRRERDRRRSGAGAGPPAVTRGRAGAMGRRERDRESAEPSRMRGGAAAGGTAPAPDLRPAPLRSPRRAGAAALAALGIAALLAAFLLTSPYVLLDFGSFWRDLSAEREHMASGHFGLAGGAAAFTYARDWFTSVMGAPLGVASLAGLAWFAWRRRAWALLGAGFLVPYLAIVGSWQMKADRYLLPLIPIAIVAAAALAEAMADAAGRRSPRLAPAVAAAAALILGAPLAARLPAHWATLRPDTRTQARRWIEDHLPRGSLVASEAYGPDVFSPLDLQALDPDLGNELLRRGLIRRLYGLLQVPMYQVQPERSAKYYVMPVWSAADVFITTDAVGSRYRREPGRFAPQLAFYDSLAARWPRLATFVPRRQPGPTITIYRNPAVKAPFAERTPPTGPDSTIGLLAHPIGEEGLFFYELGVNHEAFGQIHEARECFLLALRFGANEPDIYVNAGARLVGSIWEEGRHDAALALLDRLAARAPGPLQVAQLGGLRARLLAGAMSGGARP